jgi:hypothetical protein
LEHGEALSAGVATMPSQEQCQKQVLRILQSPAFRNASTMRQLLDYLAAKAFDHGAETLKEYTIGVEALSRPHDFDPKMDTNVRVQIHRLRQKLKEYYDSDGIRDPILVDIPKGHYMPTFETVRSADPGWPHNPQPEVERQVSQPEPLLAPDEMKTAPKTTPESPRMRWSNLRLTLIGSAAAILIFSLGYWCGNYRSGTEREMPAPGFDKASGIPDPVKTFWLSFLGNDSAPVIAYPDAVFLLDDSNDLFRFRRGPRDDRGARVDPHLAQQFASNPSLVARAGPLYYENAYSGAGELKGLALLSNLFGQMGIHPTIKPSREITPDDLKQHNVIMLGSSFQNFAVAQLTATGDFSFKNPDSRLEQWRGLIVNSHPQPSEASTYHTERDPASLVLKTDHSLITIQPGVLSGRFIATLGGLDTTGTEGAVLFATSKAGIEELTRSLAALKTPVSKDAPSLFQALLSVHLEKGYEVLGASLVSVHPLPSTHPHTAPEAISQVSTAP